VVDPNFHVLISVLAHGLSALTTLNPLQCPRAPIFPGTVNVGLWLIKPTSVNTNRTHLTEHMVHGSPVGEFFAPVFWVEREIAQQQLHMVHVRPFGIQSSTSWLQLAVVATVTKT
jgi:hypothetical protein